MRFAITNTTWFVVCNAQTRWIMLQLYHADGIDFTARQCFCPCWVLPLVDVGTVTRKRSVVYSTCR